MDFEKYLKYLNCLHCKGELVYIKKQSEYFCDACKKSFPIIDNIPRFIDVKEEILAEAKNHWESSPNFQYEAQADLYTKEYYEEQDIWREKEVDPFNMDEYKFDEIKDKVVLDIGCGSGWVIKQCAKSGAFPIGVDFTERAVISTRKALDVYNLEGLVIQADAQYLPIKTEVIDRLYSIGVLHHIPSTEKGVSEAHRIIKKEGTAFISLYGKLFFFNSFLFPIASKALKLLLKAPEVRDGIQHTTCYDEFYRFMDGSTNPIGRWYTNNQLALIFKDFKIHSINKSHFPLRYLKIGNRPLSKLMPAFMHRLLERHGGMMRNCQLSKH